MLESRQEEGTWCVQDLYWGKSGQELSAELVRVLNGSQEGVHLPLLYPKYWKLPGSGKPRMLEKSTVGGQEGHVNNKNKNKKLFIVVSRRMRRASCVWKLCCVCIQFCAFHTQRFSDSAIRLVATPCVRRST